MTIEDIMELCIDSSLCVVEVFDCETGKEVWSGAGDEIPDEYAQLEVGSFDVPKEGKMTFNV